ncbi:TetR-like C-terminal domain-containing protein [Agrococcus sp. Marseille-P2731]|uniref:TetR-like C-terminal domain-containing protein n=1 Tax=Agrococcus sp. Marseille-P2731 TaxID=1841862 RepID=UPI000931D26C|nr:TetR-like C-terminal domain-containing protein [Agrococcus sp. Marseille-P2731]
MARARTRSKVHEAVLALARESRVATITMEGIAARAGVSKQTLYRSWRSTGAILFDALLARSLDDSGAVAVPDSGDLAADLQLLVSSMVEELTEPTQEALLRAVTAEIQMDESLGELFRESLLAPQLRGVAARFRVAGVEDADAAAELLVGAVFHRWLLRTREFDGAWVAAHVARVIRAVTPGAHRPGASITGVSPES